MGVHWRCRSDRAASVEGLGGNCRLCGSALQVSVGSGRHRLKVWEVTVGCVGVHWSVLEVTDGSGGNSAPVEGLGGTCRLCRSALEVSVGSDRSASVEGLGAR